MYKDVLVVALDIVKDDDGVAALNDVCAQNRANFFISEDSSTSSERAICE